MFSFKEPFKQFKRFKHFKLRTNCIPDKIPCQEILLRIVHRKEAKYAKGEEQRILTTETHGLTLKRQRLEVRSKRKED